MEWAGRSQRAAVRAAQREAVTALRQQLAAPVSPSVNTVAGLPLPHQALALFDAVADLWS